MATLLSHTECKTCGTRHNFCYGGGHIVVGQEYQYTCPMTGKRSSLWPWEAGDPVQHAPQGAVQLLPAVKEPAAVP